MYPPNTTFAMMRWMFTGHQVGFQVAAQARSKSVPSAMTTGLAAWNVAQSWARS